MAQVINGLWTVSIDGIQFAYFNTTQSNVGAWIYRLDGSQQVWQRIPDCKSAAAVRGVAAAYRANGMAQRLDVKSGEYNQAISEIGEIPEIVERGEMVIRAADGDYEIGSTSLTKQDTERGWQIEDPYTIVRDIDFLTPAEYDHPEAVESFDEATEPEPVTAEIPEVPPMADSKAKVVKVSANVIVRDVTIPSGKSIKELADVFGAYQHKPRGFRDSKGRRVAYVAYNGETGVIAYREYYKVGSDKMLEQSITDYLAAHNLVKAA
ncbi:hypothetical protein [Bifidobacterium moukalabense]|uniref:hypothetical protein n=1 Tax=Bifidobacterium moukalabense TaxID=1333651 RepID=UPI0010F666DB|nr:hypothetical protein [Bifidobacterium moukalabense]